MMVTFNEANVKRITIFKYFNNYYKINNEHY